MNRYDKYLKQIEDSIKYAKSEKECNVYNWQDILPNKNVCAFGLGKFFEDTHERLFKMCNIKYLCDNNKEKIEEFSGKEEYQKKRMQCINPSKLKDIDNIFVIAVVGNYEPIRKQMEELGIPNIHISEMHFKYYLKGKDTTWLTDALPKINEMFNILSDDKSREVFTSVFCNKISRNISLLKYNELFSEGEYFKTGVFNLSNEEYFIDAGAYNGDTVHDFIKVTNGKFGHIYSFEINSGNYEMLNSSINTLESSIKNKIDIYKKGVWIEDAKMWCAYDGDSDGCGIVAEERGESCELIKLDNLFLDKKITIIKMDIEGAEIEALQGSKNIIKLQKPKLAICVYHRPEDLWEIPLKIKELNNDYKIYLRHHNPQYYIDTICYAY